LECRYCEVDIYFYAIDLTGGRVPITNLALNMNGKPLVNLQDISQEHLEDKLYERVSCGQDVTVELMATNSLGQEAYLSIAGNTLEGELK
jgi:hypothetical protein